MHVTPAPTPPQQQQKWTKNKSCKQQPYMHVYLNFYEKYIIGNMANVLKIQPPS